MLTLLLLAPQAAPKQATSIASQLTPIFGTLESATDPGVAVGVIHKGELVFARGYGLANLEHDVPITSRTRFRIASTSKQFTACCIALLAIDGKIDLDADIHRYLPEQPKQEVTVRQLVHHTSGIPDYLGLAMEEGLTEDVHTPERSFELIAGAPLDFAPGAHWDYSNSNYLLLGEIVHRVSGQSLAKFARKHIFEPLGMKDTLYLDSADKIIKGRADGYAPVTGGGWGISNTRLTQCGDGGVFTTIEDLARWDANFYRCTLPGGKKLLKLMLTPGQLNNGTSTGYAFGLSVDTFQGRQVVQHSGAFAGFRAQILRFPEEALTVMVLANRADLMPSVLCKQAAAALLKKQ